MTTNTDYEEEELEDLYKRFINSRDIEVRGYVVRKLNNSVLFKTFEGKEVLLPREQIAIVHEIEGVTVTLPKKLARAKGIY